MRSLEIVLLFAVGAYFLNVFHSLFLVPLCSAPIPFFMSSNFCRAVSPITHILNQRPATATTPTSRPFYCSAPFLSSLSSCHREAPVFASTPNIQAALDDQFSGFQGLLGNSLETPKMLYDIREFAMALQDLTILVKGSGLRSRDVMVATLKDIKEAGDLSSRRLQAYSSRLASSIVIFLASAEHTHKLMVQDSSVTSSIARKLACTFSPFSFCSPQIVHNAFLYTLQTFEMAIHTLSHFNGLTEESLIQLDGHLDTLGYFIREEIDLTSKEVGELLGRLWTQLGGHKNLILNAQSRYRALNNTSAQTKAMKRLVWGVRDDLYNLQVTCDSLRAYAAQPLLLQADIPKGGVVAALSEGSRALRDALEGSRQTRVRTTTLPTQEQGTIPEGH